MGFNGRDRDSLSRSDDGLRTHRLVVAVVVAVLGLIACAAFVYLAQFFLNANEGGPITNGTRTDMKVALTFDIGEREGDPAGYDAEIVRVLTENDVPATFFLGGLWMTHNEKAAKELAASELFELGNHGWSHLDFAQITPDQMASEVILTQQAMWDLLGRQSRLFRLPYGTYTDEALAVIEAHGLHTIQWDVVSGDPDPEITAERMIPWVVEQVRPGSIVIMHANGRGWHTAEALPEIIRTLREQGYVFATISDLLDLEYDAPPTAEW
jgi:peptidoglycan/xylan/chitin deacetylase (PgdA/CDA1 family)